MLSLLECILKTCQQKKAFHQGHVTLAITHLHHPDWPLSAGGVGAEKVLEA